MREIVHYAVAHAEACAQMVQTLGYSLASLAAYKVKHRTLSACYAFNALALVAICVTAIVR
jgi:hypothetical protein